MIQEKRPTVGEASIELSKKSDDKQSVIETQREMQKNYINELIKTAKDGEKKYGTERPFYVCVQTRRERLFSNVIRSQFYSRQTRPMPTYDLALYHYDPKDEKMSFVWTIPDLQTVEMMSAPDFIPLKEEEQLHYFVKCFKKGTLI